MIERSLLCQVFGHRGGVAVECGPDNRILALLCSGQYRQAWSAQSLLFVTPADGEEEGGDAAGGLGEV
ncbi:MAG: hypothetical protein OXE48_02075, partial [Gammaproteobacteria bacterium]|nr:hypothetical protein [Gammaproteobacteria bacterium]